MTTGKGLRLAVRVRRRSQAYCLGFDNQSRQISVRESSIVPDYFVKSFQLPAAGSQLESRKRAAGGCQLNILQTVVSSFHQHAVIACTFLLGKENYGQASRLISIG